MKNRIHELKNFYILWTTQELSQLGSAMTNFALTLWLYQQTGSALQTALLTICSYTPYVLMSIFAGALSDRWDKKKTLLVCDTLAALCTVSMFILLKTGLLCAWHLYLLNALNGLMNTVRARQAMSQLPITPKSIIRGRVQCGPFWPIDHHSASDAGYNPLCIRWNERSDNRGS